METRIDKSDFPTFARIWLELAPVRGWVRSRTRLSVRLMMVLVLVIGGGLGWIERGARIQRQVVAAVQAAGGRCSFSQDWRENPTISGVRPEAHPWLVRHVNVNYVDSVIAISLVPRNVHDPAKANDETLASIGKLDRLESLSLNSTAVTDAGLVHLKGKTRLKYLELSGYSNHRRRSRTSPRPDEPPTALPQGDRGHRSGRAKASGRTTRGPDHPIASA